MTKKQRILRAIARQEKESHAFRRDLSACEDRHVKCLLPKRSSEFKEKTTHSIRKLEREKQYQGGEHFDIVVGRQCSEKGQTIARVPSGKTWLMKKPMPCPGSLAAMWQAES